MSCGTVANECRNQSQLSCIFADSWPVTAFCTIANNLSKAYNPHTHTYIHKEQFMYVQLKFNC